MKKFLTVLVICVAAGWLIGCNGAAEERTDMPQESLELQQAKDTRATVEELQDALQGEGVAGLKGSIGDVMEGLEEGYDEPSGPHKATITSINNGVKELSTLLAGSPSQADVQKKMDELVALAKKLPGGESTE